MLMNPDRWKRALLAVVDGALVGVVLVVPGVMGGNSPLGRLLLVVLCGVAATAWFLRQTIRAEASWRWHPAHWLLAAGTLLLVAQITPWPAGLHARLSPATAAHLPLWHLGAFAGPWRYLSLYPDETRAALIVYLAYAALFLVAWQRLQRLADVERLLRWIALGAVAMAMLGIVQMATSPDRFYWFYEHPFAGAERYARGGFVCRNHFANYLAMGLAPLLWWVCADDRRRKATGSAVTATSQAAAWVKGMLPALVGFAILLSLSRGGMLVAAVVLAFTLAAFHRLGLVRPATLVGWLGAGALLAVLLAIDGYARLARRVDALTAGSLETLDAGAVRRRIWAANFAAACQYRWLGTGAGTHRYVYPLFLDGPTDREFTHAESGYLQIASELGLAGVLLMAAIIGTCAAACFRGLRAVHSMRQRASLVAVTAALLASGLHSLVDFVWYIPGCMAMVVLLAACAMRLAAPADKQGFLPSRRRRLPRPAWAGLLAATCVLALSLTHASLRRAVAGHYEMSYVRTFLNERPQPLEELTADRLRDTHQRDALVAWLEKQRKLLQQAVAWRPADARSHLRLAAICIDLFTLRQQHAENPMTLADLALAARAAGFTSRGELETWLQRAIGPNRQLLDEALRHACRGIRGCPVEGTGYCYLAQLGFLQSADARSAHHCIAQAIRVRPDEPLVLRAAAQLELERGNLTAAAGHLRQALHANPQEQAEFVRDLAAVLPADFVIEALQPDLHACRLLRRAYDQLQHEDACRLLAPVHAQRAEEAARQARGTAATGLWYEASQQHRTAGHEADVLRCLQRAVEADSSAFEARRQLAGCLLDQGRHNEARVHLRWCRWQRPHDEATNHLRQRLNLGDRTARYPQTAQGTLY